MAKIEAVKIFSGKKEIVKVQLGKSEVWLPDSSYVTVKGFPNNNAYGSVIGSGIYKTGDTVILNAVPADGFKFMQWSDGTTSQTKELLASSNLDLTAMFIEKASVGTLTYWSGIPD